MHEYLHLAAILGANPDPLPPKLEVTGAELQKAQQTFLSQLSGKAPEQWPILLGLNPSAQYGPAKCWPAANFVSVARSVSSRLGNCLWLTVGSGSDAKLCADIAKLAGGNMVNLAGKTSLRELMALLKLCRALLTNDSGPMHVAAALGTPVIVPFGSTTPELTGPGLPGDPRHRLLSSAAPCSPCFRRTCPIDLRCMTGITPEQVTEAVLQVLVQVG
jgi:heptosyltransferase-2